MELEAFQKDVVKPVKYSKKTITHPITILSAKESSSRNMFIRTVAYDFLNRSLLLPSQEIKRVQQEHAVAKTIKVGSLALPKESRMNPDTSRGSIRQRNC